MKSINKYLIIAIFGLFTMNCGLPPIGYMGHNTNTQVVLKEANFRVIGRVSGEASASFILLIGPTNSRLYAKAQSKLYKKANLKNNEKSRALINLTTDIGYDYFIYPLLYFKKTVTISADVVEFH